MKKIKTATIYALLDPRQTDEARYIGKTIKSMAVRLTAHLYQAKRGNRRFVYRWIRSLLLLDITPVIVELEQCPAAKWQAQEKYWIKQARLHSHRLTNLTDGGVAIPARKRWHWKTTTTDDLPPAQWPSHPVSAGRLQPSQT